MEAIFSPIADLVNLMIGVCYNITGHLGVKSYGLAIILFTIIIKMAMYPLTAKQVRSMKAMSELQPRIKKIQDQYKNDPARMREELNKIGFNPLAGCLPLLIQMPILMAVYYALQALTYEGDPSFLWVANLSEPDGTYILPVLSAISTYVVSLQTTSKDNKQLQYMTYAMPLFVGYISLQFAAGLIVYWVTMNVVQIIQQWFINKADAQKPAPKAPAVIDEGAGIVVEGTPVGGKKNKVRKIRRPKK